MREKRYLLEGHVCSEENLNGKEPEEELELVDKVRLPPNDQMRRFDVPDRGDYVVHSVETAVAEVCKDATEEYVNNILELFVEDDYGRGYKLYTIV